MILSQLPFFSRGYDGSVTAYDLLQQVCKVILEEPKRIYQGRWIVDLDDPEIETNISRSEVRAYKEEPPACHTTACTAGWIALMMRWGRHTPLNPALMELAAGVALHVISNDIPALETWRYGKPKANDRDRCTPLQLALLDVFYTFPEQGGDPFDQYGTYPPCKLGTPEYAARMVAIIHERLLVPFEQELKARVLDEYELDSAVADLMAEDDTREALIRAMVRG